MYIMCGVWDWHIPFFAVGLLTRLCVRVGVYFTCGGHWHDYVVLPGGEVLVHGNSLIPSLLERLMSEQVSGRS